MNEFDRCLIGKRLKERRELANFTLEQVGNRINKKFTTVAKYESGEIKNIDIMVIREIADMTNTNIEYLLLKSNIPDKIEVQKNIPFISNFDEDIKYNIFLYKSINDEMTPLLDSGDIAIIKKQKNIENGKTFLIQYDKKIIIRKVIDNEDTIILQAMNPYYPIITTTKDKIRIIGKVIETRNSSAFK